mmetsp:Transcript_28023/g.20973  ORF Transcript_28023/g.20973 Transcript_28023/m.20973 type:complete len:112 (-) Transcript_28023:35-370(-)
MESNSNNKVTEYLGWINSSPVMVYSKTWCGFCSEAKQVLQKAGVKYKLLELDEISEGDKVQKALEQLTGQRTVPNIFIGGTHVGGCSELKSKIKSGVVKELLNTNGIEHKL